MSLGILKIIILSCTINNNLNHECFNRVLKCNDKYYSQMLATIKPRSLAYCINNLNKG